MLTLDYFKTHPLRLPKDQSNLSIGQVRAAEKLTVHSEPIHPSAGAYIHYGGVELADMLAITKPVVSTEEMAELAKWWYASCGAVCKQLLFYTWLICSKEMRHGNLNKCDKAFSLDWEHYEEPGMHDAMALCRTISTSSGTAYASLLDCSPDIKVGPYMRAVERQFRKGGWGGSFGGVRWADITLEMVRYFYGESSAMIAADRCWTLVHNTGPIFNKGFYFQYHDGNLSKILEAQASTSVFDLGGPNSFLKKASNSYNHPVVEAFCTFAGLAHAAISTVKPDYVYGAGGGVNSDGTKPTSKPQSSAGGSDKAESPAAIKLGPFEYTTTDRETAQ